MAELWKWIVIGFAFGIGFTIASGFLNFVAGLISHSRSPLPPKS